MIATDAQSLITAANQYQLITGLTAEQVIIYLLGQWANGL